MYAMRAVRMLPYGVGNAEARTLGANRAKVRIYSSEKPKKAFG